MSRIALQCPQCNSADVMFSRKQQMHVCADCGCEFVPDETQEEADRPETIVSKTTKHGPTRVFLSYAREEGALCY